MTVFKIPFWVILVVSSYTFTETTSYFEEQNNYRDIKFVNDQVYGDTDEVFLGRIRDVEVDSEGRVYIADGQNITIQVYNPGGDYLTKIGQQGRGPGEFLRITHHTRINIKFNKLFVTGTEWIFSDKVQVFSLNDYSLSAEILFNESEKKAFDPDLENYFPKNVYPLGNERLLVSYEHIRSPEYLERDENKILYYLHDQTGSITTGPVLEQKDRINLYQVYNNIGYNYYAFPFFGKSLITVSKDGLIYTAYSDKFIIEVRTPDGEHIRTLEHPFHNVPLTKRELIQKYEEIDMSRLDFNEGDDVALQMIREADNLPQTWPALENMFIDDENRLWVSTIVEDFDIYEWWVLEDSGELITKFEWPRNEPIEVVKNGYMYTRETNEETGLQQVVRYRIEFEES